MDQIIMIELSVVIVVILIVLGSILIGWKSAIRKENGIHDFGVTSNGQKKWFMDSKECTKTWFGVKITGKYSGNPPHYGEVIYYRNKGMNIPVFVYGVRKKGKQILSLKLFGIKCSQVRENGALTNIRRPEQIRSSQKITNIQYPIIVKRKIKDLLIGTVVLGMGMVFLIYDSMNAEFSVLFIIILLVAAVNLYSGGVLFFDYLTFGLEITENDQLILKQKGKKKYYRIGELNYTVTNPNPEQYLVMIQDHDHKELSRFDSQDVNGISAYQIIKEAIQQKNTEDLYRKLLSQNYYLPLTEDGFIVEHIPEDDSEMRVSIFESEKLLEEVVSYSELAGDEIVTIEEAVGFTENFSSVQEIRIVKKDDHGKIYYYTITKEIWEEMKDLEKVS